MQETYFTSQHSEGRGKGMCIVTKKVKMTQQTYTNPELHIRQTLCQVQALYLHVHVYVCIFCAKHFVYNSCLFIACNLNYPPERKNKVSKLFIRIPLVK